MQTERGRGDRKSLAARGCRGQEVAGEKVEGLNTASVRHEVEAIRSGRVYRWTGDPIPEEKKENRMLKERYN